MSGNPTERSPLARLVVFMVCLSIAGSIVAGVYTYAAGLQQPAVPTNDCDRQNNYCWASACNKCHLKSAECIECLDYCIKFNFPDCGGWPAQQ